MLLANGLNTFFINGQPTFINGPSSLSRNPSDCTILDSLVFDQFILADDYESLKLVYQLVIIPMENYSHHWNRQSYLMKDLELLQ